VSFRYRNAKTDEEGTADRVRRSFPVAGPAACLAEGLPAGAQLRLFAPQLQARDRLAARAAEVRSWSDLAWVKERAPILCTCCGAVMAIVQTQLRPLFAGTLSIPIATQEAN
jgi:hypothetical protein